MYTKGKWKILSDGLTIKAEIEHKPHYDAESPQTFIAKCFQNGHIGRTKRPTEEDFSNARLIAAAPDLLAALWFVLGDAETEIPLYLLLENGRKAKQAIEKTGEKL